ncbi:MAG TPA: hypothetical protein PLC76_05855 [Saprospiraceae bacterium]|jgi:hypothetical protein|nr:hypothetical protein [Saprospiraceae bacterium]HRN32915.1 hypothetical protein [Saprospiraceae bacterium]HRP84232.1 hypothetical protein [Saprospiraceae bacterium]
METDVGVPLWVRLSAVLPSFVGRAATILHASIPGGTYWRMIDIRKNRKNEKNATKGIGYRLKISFFKKIKRKSKYYSGAKY